MSSAVVVDLCGAEPAKRVCREPREVSRRDFTTRRTQWGTERVDARTRRTLLTVFEFLSVSCLETAAGLVCRAWLQLSRDEELWRAKYISEFHPAETAPTACYRAGFIDSQLGSCWHCRQYINHFGVECRALGRLLCMTCARLPVCRIMPVSLLLKKFFLHRAAFARLRVPIFDYEHAPSTYVALLTRRLVPVYERRWELLARSLTGRLEKRTLKKLKRVNFTAIFEGNCTFKYTAALLSFCGKNEEAEDLEESICEFVERMKRCS